MPKNPNQNHYHVINALKDMYMMLMQEPLKVFVATDFEKHRPYLMEYVNLLVFMDVIEPVVAITTRKKEVIGYRLRKERREEFSRFNTNLSSNGGLGQAS